MTINEDKIVELLNPESRIVVLTGAGVSAESGIPTFRDAQQGLWAEYDPEEMASMAGFRKDPKLVLEWYDWRRHQIMRASPNRAHTILAEWSHRLPLMTLITQNVDGLHQKAGSRDTIEMHGSIHRLVCLDKRHQAPWPSPLGEPPTCQLCGSLLRPDVVWFGEMLDRKVLANIDSALERCQLFIAIGTSGLVYPAAGFLERAKGYGAFTVVINKERMPKGTADLQLEGLASEILERINGLMPPTPVR